jgi:hypothetical protein
MLKINHCLLGLTLVGGIISLTAAPVRAESKVSQCKRFDQTMNSFSQQLAPALKLKKTRDREQALSSLDHLLKVSGKGLTQIQARKFTDPKLQSMQDQALGIYTDFHNSFVQITNAVDQNDRALADKGLKMMEPLAPREQKLRGQFRQYCGGK